MKHNYYHDISDIQEQEEFINLNKSINKANFAMPLNFGVKIIIIIITMIKRCSSCLSVLLIQKNNF